MVFASRSLFLSFFAFFLGAMPHAFAVPANTSAYVHHDARSNLFWEFSAGYQDLSAAQIQALNAQLILLLQQEPLPAPVPNRLTVAPLPLLGEIYRAVVTNPVTSIAAPARDYDPNNQGIGFCFGRAMNVQLEAIYRGMNQRSILKIWAIGALRAGNVDWGWHVATLIRGADGGWHAIDPIFGRPLPLPEWYRQMAPYSTDGRMGLVVSDPLRFGPGGAIYENRVLADPYYNGYFLDLLAFYRNRFRTPISPRTRPK